MVPFLLTDKILE